MKKDFSSFILRFDRYNAVFRFRHPGTNEKYYLPAIRQIDIPHWTGRKLGRFFNTLKEALVYRQLVLYRYKRYCATWWENVD